MRVGFVSHCLPQPDVSGGAMTCWAIIRSLHQAGHEVDLYYLKEAMDKSDTPERRALLQPYLRRFEVMATPTEGQILEARGSRGRWGRIKDQLFTPPFELLFPSFAMRSAMADEFRENPVDLLFCYHWSAAAAVHGLHPAPKMIATGDLVHRPAVARWELLKPELSASYLKTTIFALRDKIHRTRGMITLLKDGDDVGSFGFFDAAWLRKKGEPRSRYFLTAIEDPAGEGWAAKRTDGHGGKFKIITAISNLQSTSTRSAMSFVATEMIPTLERELGQDAFEIHVIGTGTPPPEMARLLPRPNIVMRGYVPDIDPEFYSADLLLSPTPIFLGFRIRVITGFAFGCCVVAHKNEAINMPEMVNEKNALLADNGPDMARAVIRAYRDAALRRRLGDAARKTYEENFLPSVSGVKLVREMEALAKKREAVRA